jgi:hypothetical protein
VMGVEQRILRPSCTPLPPSHHCLLWARHVHHRWLAHFDRFFNRKNKSFSRRTWLTLSSIHWLLAIFPLRTNDVPPHCTPRPIQVGV